MKKKPSRSKRKLSATQIIRIAGAIQKRPRRISIPGSSLTETTKTNATLHRTKAIAESAKANEYRRDSQ